MEKTPIWKLDFPLPGHAGAVTASFSLSTGLPLEEVCVWLTEGMVTLGDWVWEQGGVVGHIKAAVRGPLGEVRMYSLTCREPEEKKVSALEDNVFDGKDALCQVHLAAIVFLVGESELQDKMEKLQRSLGTRSIAAAPEKKREAFKKISYGKERTDLC